MNISKELFVSIGSALLVGKVGIGRIARNRLGCQVCIEPGISFIHLTRSNLWRSSLEQLSGLGKKLSSGILTTSVRKKLITAVLSIGGVFLICSEYRFENVTSVTFWYELKKMKLLKKGKVR